MGGRQQTPHAREEAIGRRLGGLVPKKLKVRKLATEKFGCHGKMVRKILQAICEKRLEKSWQAAKKESEHQAHKMQYKCAKMRICATFEIFLKKMLKDAHFLKKNAQGRIG